MNESELKADALRRAFLHSEISLADCIERNRLAWSSFPTSMSEIARRRGSLTAAYYRELHSTNELYSQNNWLLDDLDTIQAWRPATVTELGAGNCRFSAAIAPLVRKVTAIDWALHPAIELPPNVARIEGDIRSTPVPPSDVVCSADFLEHLPSSDLPGLIKAASDAARGQLHVVACYDDGHSHLTIMPPGAWLALFREISPDFELAMVDCRRNDARQVVCTIQRKPGSSNP